MSKRAVTIAFANQKGGVGKTTSTIEIATILSKLERNVLVIDLDQQCNLTDNTKVDKSLPTIYNLFSDDEPDIEAAIQDSEAGYKIIAGSEAMSRADVEFQELEHAYLLKDLIDALAESFDYILIDNAPAKNRLLNMTYIAVDYLIMCADSGKDSIAGIQAIVKDMMKFHGKRKLADSKIMGVIISRYRNTNIGNAIVEIVNQTIEDDIPQDIKTEEKPFIMTVREAAAADEAKMMNKPLQQYKNSATAAMDYRYIVDEIIKRVEGV